MYQHRDQQGQVLPLPVGKVVCVGRNYLAHIHELNNEVPTEPLLFIKPATALCDVHAGVAIPTHQGECHNELEIALLLDKPLKNASVEQAAKAICGVGLALDLTLRDVQAEAKRKGLPWERAKAFDNSCPVSGFAPVDDAKVLSTLQFSLHINGEVRQQGDAALMMHDPVNLLCAMSAVFTLCPGDIVLTGTPQGVGPLFHGDQLHVSMAPWFDITTQVS